MDIKDLSNNINNRINGSGKLSDQSPKIEENQGPKRSDEAISDKVSLNSSFKSNKSEEIFAKIELEKFRAGSFDKLRDMKAKITEYEAMKEVSPEKAKETELGKLIDNPDVWGAIAEKMTR